MFSLFIDTTQKKCNLAVLRENKIVNKISILTNNNLTDIVVEHIGSLLEKTKITKNNIQKIFLVIGPGSFTGVKVGTIIAKTWAIVKRTPIYTLDSLLLQIPSDSGISLLDARGNKKFCAVYRNNKNTINPTMLDSSKLKKIIAKNKDLKVFDDYKEVDVFDGLVHHIKDFKMVSNYHKLAPLYIREPL